MRPAPLTPCAAEVPLGFFLSTFISTNTPSPQRGSTHLAFSQLSEIDLGKLFNLFHLPPPRNGYVKGDAAVTQTSTLGWLKQGQFLSQVIVQVGWAPGQQRAMPHWANSGTQTLPFSTRLPQSLWWSWSQPETGRERVWREHSLP